MVNLQKTLNNLFVSKVRIKVLKYFYQNPEVKIHLRAITRELKEEVNAVRRELLRLVDINFLSVVSGGNKKFFSINSEFPFYEDFLGIVYKCYGLGEDLIKGKDKLGVIYFAAFTNAYVRKAREKHNEIDLIIVGDVDLDALGTLVSKEEKKTGREINYTVIKLGDFNLRKSRQDPFIQSAMIDTQIMLIGTRNEFVH